MPRLFAIRCVNAIIKPRIVLENEAPGIVVCLYWYYTHTWSLLFKIIMIWIRILKRKTYEYTNKKGCMYATRVLY